MFWCAYKAAGVAPPVALYVDCGCCKQLGETKLKARFSEWPDLIVRLDIWHFMQRLAVGCTTDAHQLYPTFMARMSACIFEWDAGDVNKLREAKRAQLNEQGWPHLSEKQLDWHITKAELELHCRRRTRGEDETIRLLDQLIGELMTDRGKDALGVPLLDPIKMQHIWRVQKRQCIQDPPGLALYTQTGTIIKGGVQLQTLRCARGSTSLESFHLHLNRFIPGNSASSLLFQMYLLDGLHRWNQNRAAAAVEVNSLGLWRAASQCELIGLQYLLRQNNEPLQDMSPDSEEARELLTHLDEQVPLETDEGLGKIAFSDATLTDLQIEADTSLLLVHKTPAELVQSASTHLSAVQPASTHLPVQPQSTHLSVVQPESTYQPVQPQSTHLSAVQPASTYLSVQPESTHLPVQPQSTHLSAVQPASTHLPVQPQSTHLSAVQIASTHLSAVQPASTYLFSHSPLTCLLSSLRPLTCRSSLSPLTCLSSLRPLTCLLSSLRPLTCLFSHSPLTCLLSSLRSLICLLAHLHLHSKLYVKYSGSIMIVVNASCKRILKLFSRQWTSMVCLA
ncbi:hypothetical protein WMY93_019842 [Mugilogobius chulae]|uniref:Uncharacterized protein n=1 Tax=Mugilogobius chulae TaxID=88201 RepID=A0AAW0NL69_9GOBI